MSYAIICEARSGFELGITTLALVDRKKVRDSFWTSDSIHDIYEIKTKRKAKEILSKLHFNDPEIVSYKTARKIINDQNNEIIHNQALSDMELGWDGHKIGG